MKNYQEDFDFYIIDQDSNHTIDLPHYIKTIKDPQGELFNYFRVMSTPHAMLIETDGTVFFSGNYNNKNGLCGPTDIQWSAPAIALKFLYNQSDPPIFPAYQLLPTGCELSKL
ncbi:hypothetical protein N7E81_18035 [Reichenbachiella carrageenanivorans]|uniref:Uncharacterized protein n=1 Tax=Reichenbachiella carrageenanivorans TaxID=2979869 RepID=A0ABY6CZC0_9BACT|nr:hypothetical protein [Reichenbachiella carrageenanivorans]UXX79257.1 hypothetical protein N7E81_18035 [Reichenbachiella carrageenanivorans]